ncbi:hypothetical protein ACQUFY_10835 [Robbsia andropogonis]|uniref:hypothetical protein n=1 Tax=Robbsia andropogonis TaxID=28092 RepID=UPI003D21CA47
MLNISVKSDVRNLARRLDGLARKQMPFATAQAINATAERVRQAERANMQAVLDEPTPFTLSSVAVAKATKSRREALVYVKAVAAEYLKPYEFGGTNKLNSLALLIPVGAKVNKYGNLSRFALKRLLARPDVFVGPVTFSATGKTVNGVWQRPPAGSRKGGGSGTKRNTQRKAGGARTGLKLLIRFTDAHEVKQHLDYRGVGARTVKAHFRNELDAAMKKALASAK